MRPPTCAANGVGSNPGSANSTRDQIPDLGVVPSSRMRDRGVPRWVSGNRPSAVRPRRSDEGEVVGSRLIGYLAGFLFNLGRDLPDERLASRKPLPIRQP